MKFYREPNGDYLAIDEDSRRAYPTYQGPSPIVWYTGRAAAIASLATSVSTVNVGSQFLTTCTKVSYADVPTEWLERF